MQTSDHRLRILTLTKAPSHTVRNKQRPPHWRPKKGTHTTISYSHNHKTNYSKKKNPKMITSRTGKTCNNHLFFLKQNTNSSVIRTSAKLDTSFRSTVNQQNKTTHELEYNGHTERETEWKNGNERKLNVAFNRTLATHQDGHHAMDPSNWRHSSSFACFLHFLFLSRCPKYSNPSALSPGWNPHPWIHEKTTADLPQHTQYFRGVQVRFLPDTPRYLIPAMVASVHRQHPLTAKTRCFHNFSRIHPSSGWRTKRCPSVVKQCLWVTVVRSKRNDTVRGPNGGNIATSICI